MKRSLWFIALCTPLLAAASQANPPANSQANPFTGGNAQAGASKAAVCMGCHGPAGNSANPAWPKLAGQGANYLYRQLQNYKSGARPDPLMGPQAAGLADEDMRDLAAYFATQKIAPGVASEASIATAQSLYRAGDAKAGIPACAACHGPDGAGIEASGYPRIGGQHATYLTKVLRDMRGLATQLDGLPNGPLQTMAPIAGKLSDAQIDALASYLNGLHST